MVIYRPEKGKKKMLDPLRIMANSHSQIGSYFGGVLLAADVNGDDKDDLFVSAPLYIAENTDEGRVFVYHSQSTTNATDAWVNLLYM